MTVTAPEGAPEAATTRWWLIWQPNVRGGVSPGIHETPRPVANFLPVETVGAPVPLTDDEAVLSFDELARRYPPPEPHQWVRL